MKNGYRRRYDDDNYSYDGRGGRHSADYRYNYSGRYDNDRRGYYAAGYKSTDNYAYSYNDHSRESAYSRYGAGYGDNGYDSIGYGDTRYDNTSYGNTRYGNAGYGSTGYGNTGYGSTGYGNSGYGSLRYTDYYTDGSAVRKPDYRDDEQAVTYERRRASASVRRRQAAQSAINLPFVLLLAVSVTFLVLICANMLKIQYNIFQHRGNIKVIENQTTRLRAHNDALFEEITAYSNIERIRSIAVSEYGMEPVAGGTARAAAVNLTESEYVHQNEPIPGRRQE